MNCKICENLDDMEREYPDGATHGAQIICDECGAEYYEEYEGKMWGANQKALENHPKLELI